MASPNWTGRSKYGGCLRPSQLPIRQLEGKSYYFHVVLSLRPFVVMIQDFRGPHYPGKALTISTWPG